MLYQTFNKIPVNEIIRAISDKQEIFRKLGFKLLSEMPAVILSHDSKNSIILMNKYVTPTPKHLIYRLQQNLIGSYSKNSKLNSLITTIKLNDIASQNFEEAKNFSEEKHISLTR